MMHSAQTYWTKDLEELAFFYLMVVKLCIQGWAYHWGYKQLAFFCLNVNLICISFFWYLWTATNGSVIRY